MLTVSAIVVAVFVLAGTIAVLSAWMNNGCNIFDYIFWVRPALEALSSLMADVITVIFSSRD